MLRVPLNLKLWPSYVNILSAKLSSDSRKDVSDTNDQVKKDGAEKDFMLQMPEAPLTCCGSGCQNCVYLVYADELIKYYEHKYSDRSQGLKQALDEVNKLTDESLKSYIIMEMTMKFRE